jgi:hypothetical protein
MGILASNCKGTSSKSDFKRTTLNKNKSVLTKSNSVIQTDHYSDSYFPNNETTNLIKETSNYPYFHKQPNLYKSRSISILNHHHNQSHLNKQSNKPTKANYIRADNQNNLSVSSKSVDKCCQAELISKEEETTNKVKIIEILNADVKSKIYNHNNSIIITIQTSNSKINESSSNRRSRKRHSKKRDQKAKKLAETDHLDLLATDCKKKSGKSLSPDNSNCTKTAANCDKNHQNCKLRKRHHSMNENYPTHRQHKLHNNKRNNYFYHYHQHFIHKHPKKLTTTTATNDFDAPKIDMATLNLLEDMRMSPSISIMSESSFYRQKSGSVFSNLYNQSKLIFNYLYFLI